MGIIDVIDTAVKVGLGALISGVTTYFLTKLNIQTGKKSELAKRKIETILFSIEKIEIYLSSFNACYARVSGFLARGIQSGPLTDSQFKWYKEADINLVNAWKERDIAVSRLRLIGLNKAAEYIYNIGKLESDFRQMVVFQRRLPSNEELMNISKSLVLLRDEVYLLLTKYLEELHS